MKIILMRHGKPFLTQTDWVAPVEMDRWIEHYNLSMVEADCIPINSLKLANSASCIVASTAARTLSSVQALGHTASVADAVFCEAQLPFALWRFPRLAPFVWVAFFRLLWFFGYSQNSESVQVTKTRAKAAAQKLISLAEKGTVLLVGHGIMNHLIAKELIVLGWGSSTRLESKYWSASVYELQTPVKK
jgi:broad specificity phosphatase PhoE